MGVRERERRREARDEEAARLAREAAEDEFDAAVKAIVLRLVAGPDPSVVADVVAVDDSKLAPPDAVVEWSGSLTGRRRLPPDPHPRLSTRCSPRLNACARLWRCWAILSVFRRFTSRTNGKTSTARMVEALRVSAACWQIHFASPDVGSRTHGHRRRGDFPRGLSSRGRTSSRQLVDRESIGRGRPRMSFFEAFTVMAAASSRSMGRRRSRNGRARDATNDRGRRRRHPSRRHGPRAVAWPHDRGDCAEKVGIVAGSLSSRRSRTLRRPSTDAAREAKARLVAEGPSLQFSSARKTAVGGQFVTLRNPGARYEDVLLALKGGISSHAAVALAAAEAFFGAAPSRPTRRARLHGGFRPGAFETVRSSTVGPTPRNNPTARRPRPTPARVFPGQVAFRRRRRNDGRQRRRNFSLRARLGRQSSSPTSRRIGRWTPTNSQTSRAAFSRRTSFRRARPGRGDRPRSRPGRVRRRRVIFACRGRPGLSLVAAARTRGRLGRIGCSVLMWFSGITGASFQTGFHETIDPMDSQRIFILVARRRRAGLVEILGRTEAKGTSSRP